MSVERKMFCISKRMLKRGLDKIGAQMNKSEIKSKSEEMVICVTGMIYKKYPDITKEEFENVVDILYEKCNEDYFIDLFG